MGDVAVVLEADSGFGKALCESLLDRGWTVFAGSSAGETEYAERFHRIPMSSRSLQSLESAARTVSTIASHVDMLVCNADQTTEDSFIQGLDFEEMKQTYDVNALGSLRFVETFLPLTDPGKKRLCFITDAAGSIAMSTGTENFGYSMSRAAVHMAVMILFNHLGKEGYTFRLYIPGNDNSTSAALASEYFIQDREDELRVTIRDDQGEEWPF